MFACCGYNQAMTQETVRHIGGGVQLHVDPRATQQRRVSDALVVSCAALSWSAR